MWFSRFRYSLRIIFSVWMLAVVIQSAGRLYLLLTQATPEIYARYSSDIIKMFQTGLLFDIRVASIIAAVLLVVALILSVSQRGFLWWRKRFAALATLMSFIVLWMTVVNVFYYKTYERAIDIFIFGLITDDTKAILVTMWNDYPIVLALLAICALLVTLYFLFSTLAKKFTVSTHSRPTVLLQAIAVLLTAGVIFIGARGSLDTFPLRESDTQVSEVKLINMLVPNGLMALDWAYKDFKRDNVFEPATDEAGSELLSTFYGQPTEPSLSAFMDKTPTNLYAKKNPPHVVFAVMESMGEHLLTLDSPERDLFGELRTHWQEDTVFQRFVSEGDGTIDSLSRFLVRSPRSNISQSSAQFLDFKSNMFKPYLENGYKIVFVTSGNGGWRNLNLFLPHLGVTEFVDQNKLQTLYPEAVASTWGIPDEYMFKFVLSRLKQADEQGEHLLFLLLSTTHHPPYRVPEHYSVPKFTLTSAELTRFEQLGTEEELQTILGTLRYVNDQLGQFMTQIKTSSLANHTLVAITGDHNIRGIGYPQVEERVLGHAVPFYLYSPADYLNNAAVDKYRVGSHKDIWPTLYQLSLSETPYFKMGCSLVAKTVDTAWCFGYNPEVVFNQEGAYLNGGFYPWLSQDSTLLATKTEISPERQAEYQRQESTGALLKWQIDRQVQDAR